MTTRVNALAHLVQTLQAEGDILVFLGAGSSTEGSQGDAPFPDFETLISRVLRDEGIAVTEDRMNAFLDVMRRWESESVLSARLTSYLYGNPGMSHLQLASVTMSVFPEVNMTIYLTTNFDDLMFKALSAVTKNSPQRDPKAFSLRKSALISEITEIFRAIPSHTHKGTPVIVKLFGDLASTSPIFNSRDMPFDEFTEDKLVKLLDRTTLFIGYGFHDAPILRLLIRSASKHPVFVVAPANPIDEQIVQIGQRQFYWIQNTFSEFVSELIATLSARRPTFEETFASFLREAGTGFAMSSRWALRDCVRNASEPARARFLNRSRGVAAGSSTTLRHAVARSDTGPDFGAFKRSDGRILAIVGESGSGKSTLLFQIYEQSGGEGKDLYVYYDAHSLQTTGSLGARLALDFAVDTAKVNAVLRQIASTLQRNDAQLFVLIDALNESGSVDPLAIRYEIESLANGLPGNVRFIYSCRRVFWDARMNPSNDLPLSLYSEGKVFLLSKFSAAEARSAFARYREEFQLKSEYQSLSASVREHIRDPLMLRFISEAYRGSVFPQFAPAALVFRHVMDALRRRYRQTPLIDFLDYLIDQRLDELTRSGDADDVFVYRVVRTDSNLALLAQQMVTKRGMEHPLTILEDENIITPMEGAAIRFKFTYERFYEYLIGLRLHYRIFTVENDTFAGFVEASLGMFRNAHYTLYQGLESAFVMEFLGTNDIERRHRIAALASHDDPSIASFGRDILREVIFESGHDASDTLALLTDRQTPTTALILDLGFESEGVLPYAVAGLFDPDIQIRRRSVRCLLFHVRNFGALDAIPGMILEASTNEAIGKEASAAGLVYFLAVVCGAATDPAASLFGLRDLFSTLIEQPAGGADLADLADALNDAVVTEGPLFFGANYDADGVVYPWHSLRQDVLPYTSSIAALLRDASLETLRRHLHAVLFFSDIRVEPAQELGKVRLFGFQIEYRIVQWILIRSWDRDTEGVLNYLDRIVEQGQPFNIDFALGIVEHGVFRSSEADRKLVTRCHAKMSEWIEHFESRFPAEFYLGLEADDPFSFNLAPLAVLAHVEAYFFTAESGVIPCIANWLADESPSRRKMALLAANWLAHEFPTKVLTTLEPTVQRGGLEDWYDRVFAGYEKHAPRLLDEFFNKLRFPIRRRTNIRTLDVARREAEVQYHGESFFACLFLGSAERLRRLAVVYDMIYAAPSLRAFCHELLEWWIVDGVAVE